MDEFLELQRFPLWKRLWRRHRYWLRSNLQCPISMDDVWDVPHKKPVFRLLASNGRSHAFVAKELAEWCWKTGKFKNILNNQALNAYDIVRLDRACNNGEAGSNLFARRYHYEWKAYDEAKCAHQLRVDVMLDEWTHQLQEALVRIPHDDDAEFARATISAVLPMRDTFWNFARVNLQVAQSVISDTMVSVSQMHIAPSTPAAAENEDPPPRTISAPACQLFYAALNCFLWESQSRLCMQARGSAPEQPTLFWAGRSTIPIHVRQGWLAHERASSPDDDAPPPTTVAVVVATLNNNNDVLLGAIDATITHPPPPPYEEDGEEAVIDGANNPLDVTVVNDCEEILLPPIMRPDIAETITNNCHVAVENSSSSSSSSDDTDDDDSTTTASPHLSDDDDEECHTATAAMNFNRRSSSGEEPAALTAEIHMILAAPRGRRHVTERSMATTPLPPPLLRRQLRSRRRVVHHYSSPSSGRHERGGSILQQHHQLFPSSSRRCSTLLATTIISSSSTSSSSSDTNSDSELSDSSTDGDE